MADKFSSDVRSKIMSKIKGKDTLIEMSVRSLLRSSGIHYRLHGKHLPGKPDVYITKLKTVIFVNGCFWHQHSCEYFKYPSSNVDFWKSKLDNNKKRDQISVQTLIKMGWKVIVIWGCSWNKDKIKSEQIIGLYLKKAINGHKKFYELSEQKIRSFSFKVMMWFSKNN